MQKEWLDGEEGIIVQLSEGMPEHIIVDGDCICNKSNEVSVFRTLLPDESPVFDASMNLCSECLVEWEENIKDDEERVETIECQCQRLDGGVWHCGEVVPSKYARAVKQNSNAKPVCRECFEWMSGIDEFDINRKFEETPSWREFQESEEVES